MFQKLAVVAVALASLTSALVIPRAISVPSSYNETTLEPYQTYRIRYAALDCAQQHNTTFFEQCCHPLLHAQNLTDRPSSCTPSPAALSSASSSLLPTTATPAPTPSPSVTDSLPDVGAVLSNTFTGSGTYFYQNNNPGACGIVHADTDRVVALDTVAYQNGANCGKTIMLINKTNGKTTTAVVADECPTCISDYSVDCSLGTFEELDDLAVGIFDLEWYYTST